jgi:siroheme decarboxylase
VQPIERELLNIIQHNFPLETRPFARIGQQLGISESECISMLQRLQEDGVLREIRPVISWNNAGFTGVLIGIVVDPVNVDDVAAAINTIPGVTHNYLREGKRNLWCTLTCDGAIERERHLAFMRSIAGVVDLKVFASEKTYKIGLVLDV